MKKAPRSIPRFGQGDVVGCGVAKLKESFGIFFTLNGRFLGVSFLLRASSEPRFWPCISVDASWQISVNFGARPFSFAPRKLVELPNHLNRSQHVNDLSGLLEHPTAFWQDDSNSSGSMSDWE